MERSPSQVIDPTTLLALASEALLPESEELPSFLRQPSLQAIKDTRLRLGETAIGEHPARSRKVVQFTKDLLNVPEQFEEALQTGGVTRAKQFQGVAKALRLNAEAMQRLQLHLRRQSFALGKEGASESR